MKLLKDKVLLQDMLLLAVVLAFLFSVLWSGANSEYAFDNRPGHVYDNYFIAKTAKNVSQGKGWGLWNGEEFVHFEREISTGPTLFLPVALALKFIDDRDVARYIGVLFVNLLLVAAFFWKLRYFFPRQVYTAAWLMLPFLLMGCMRPQWYLVLGEVSAIFFVMLSGLCIALKNPSNKVIVLSGVLSGMAIMSKLLAIISAAWVAGFLLALMTLRHGFHQGIRNLTLWGVGFFSFPFIIALWHFAVFDGSVEKLLGYMLDYLGFYIDLGKNAAPCEDYAVCFMQYFGVAKSAWKLGHAVYSPYFAAATLLVPVLGLYVFFKSDKTNADYLMLVLAGICFMQLYYFFEVGGRRWPRYYFMGAVSALIWLCLFTIEYFNKWIKLTVVKSVIFSIAMVGALYQSLPLYREQKVASYQAYSREVADYVNDNKEINEVVWWGVGSQPFPIVSYYLDGDKRWINLSGFSLYYLDSHIYAVQQGEDQVMHADLSWKNPGGHYFLFEQWRDINLPVPVCTKNVFSNDLYAVFYCSAPDIEKLLSHTSQGRFRFVRGTPNPAR